MSGNDDFDETVKKKGKGGCMAAVIAIGLIVVAGGVIGILAATGVIFKADADPYGNCCAVNAGGEIAWWRDSGASRKRCGMTVQSGGTDSVVTECALHSSTIDTDGNPRPWSLETRSEKACVATSVCSSASRTYWNADGNEVTGYPPDSDWEIMCKPFNQDEETCASGQDTVVPKKCRVAADGEADANCSDAHNADKITCQFSVAPTCDTAAGLGDTTCAAAITNNLYHLTNPAAPTCRSASAQVTAAMAAAGIAAAEDANCGTVDANAATTCTGGTDSATKCELFADDEATCTIMAPTCTGGTNSAALCEPFAGKGKCDILVPSQNCGSDRDDDEAACNASGECQWVAHATGCTTTDGTAARQDGDSATCVYTAATARKDTDDATCVWTTAKATCEATLDTETKNCVFREGTCSLTRDGDPDTNKLLNCMFTPGVARKDVGDTASCKFTSTPAANCEWTAACMWDENTDLYQGTCWKGYGECAGGGGCSAFNDYFAGGCGGANCYWSTREGPARNLDEPCGPLSYGLGDSGFGSAGRSKEAFDLCNSLEECHWEAEEDNAEEDIFMG